MDEYTQDTMVHGPRNGPVLPSVRDALNAKVIGLGDVLYVMDGDPKVYFTGVLRHKPGQGYFLGSNEQEMGLDIYEYKLLCYERLNENGHK